MHYGKQDTLTTAVIKELFTWRPAFRTVQIGDSCLQRVCSVPPFRYSGIPVALTKHPRRYNSHNISLISTGAIIEVTETMAVMRVQVTQDLIDVGRNQDKISVEGIAWDRNGRVRLYKLAGFRPP